MREMAQTIEVVVEVLIFHLDNMTTYEMPSIWIQLKVSRNAKKPNQKLKNQIKKLNQKLKNQIKKLNQKLKNQTNN